MDLKHLKSLLDQAKEKKPEVAATEVKYHPAIADFPPRQIEAMFDSFSVPALQWMAAKRGVVGDSKKSRLVQDLARTFTNEKSIQTALSKLTEEARYAFARIKIAGGIADRKTWRTQLVGRYGEKRTDQIEQELVGSALAFYASLEGFLLQPKAYAKHEVGKPANFYGSIKICTPPRILSVFMPGVSLTEMLAPPPPKPYKGTEPQVAAEANFEVLLADVFTFLRYVEQNSVKTVQTGGIGKRDFVKLNEQLTVKETANMADIKKLSDLGRLNFLWSILLQSELITVTMDGRATTQSQTVEKFYALPRYQQVGLLTEAWVESQFNEFVRIPTLDFLTTSPNSSDVPDASRVVPARNTVMALVQTYFDKGQLSDGWLDFGSFIANIKDLDLELLIPRTEKYNQYYGYTGYFGNEYYNGFISKLKPVEKKKNNYIPSNALLLDTDWELVEGEWVAQLFREPMAWLGIAELGIEAQKKRPVGLRLTELGRAMLAGKPSAQEEEAARVAAQIAAQSPDLNKSLIVQPNFDVMVLAPLQNLPLLQQIDRFASRTSMGDVAMYRINKESALKGLRTGLTGQDILKILEDNSRVPVSQNIAASLSDWNAEFERLILHPKTTLLEVPDPAILDKLLSDPKTSPHIEKRLGPTFALIKGKPQNLDKALALLSNGKQDPIHLDYTHVQAASILAEGDRRLTVKEYAGNPYIFYRLGQFADFVEWNAATRKAVFKLSAEAGQRAQVLGLTYTMVRSFLDTRGVTRQPLPPTMALALKGWLGFYSPIKGERAVTITVTISSQLDDIFNLPEFKPMLIARSGPKVALVKEEVFLQLKNRLQELGIGVEAPDLLPEQAHAKEVSPTTEEIAEDTSRRGRRASTETQAERERRQREATEEIMANRPNPFLLPRGPVFGEVIPADEFDDVEEPDLNDPQTALEFVDLMRLLTSGRLIDLNDDGDDDGPPFGFGRRRRKRR